MNNKEYFIVLLEDNTGGSKHRSTVTVETEVGLDHLPEADIMFVSERVMIGDQSPAFRDWKQAYHSGVEFHAVDDAGEHFDPVQVSVLTGRYSEGSPFYEGFWQLTNSDRGGNEP